MSALPNCHDDFTALLAERRVTLSLSLLTTRTQGSLGGFVIMVAFLLHSLHFGMAKHESGLYLHTGISIHNIYGAYWYCLHTFSSPPQAHLPALVYATTGIAIVALAAKNVADNGDFSRVIQKRKTKQIYETSCLCHSPRVTRHASKFRGSIRHHGGVAFEMAWCSGMPSIAILNMGIGIASSNTGGTILPSLRVCEMKARMNKGWGASARGFWLSSTPPRIADEDYRYYGTACEDDNSKHVKFQSATDGQAHNSLLTAFLEYSDAENAYTMLVHLTPKP
ncbi:hypothetical protein CFE70_002371 [Pyrenophora teres f. teres 0-1]